MGQGRLSKEEQAILKKNPNVFSANEYQLRYTEDFKKHFRKEYVAGKSPTEIFTEAGFDKKILGHKRIERAAARWRDLE